MENTTDTQAQAHARMDAYFAEHANTPPEMYTPPTYVYKPIRLRRFEGPQWPAR